MKIYLLNMNRRYDRLKKCESQFSQYNLSFERIVAIDGNTIPMPSGFINSPGALGCRESHCLALRTAIDSGEDEALILEDDFVFCPNFTEKLKQFLAIVPEYDCLFLGGQHMIPAKTVLPGVSHCQQTTRTHAYLIRKHYMPTLLAIFQGSNRHIDHEWAHYQYQHSPAIYAPEKEWLVGQGESVSDINPTRSVMRERWWRPRQLKHHAHQRPIPKHKR